MDELRIVQGTLTQRYIALSYVWGQTACLSLSTANRDGLMTKGSLHGNTKVGRTILDAMSVCKSMGERYLWVDSLCIVQDDEVEKSNMIARMDDVYGHSLLTIINATQGKADANALLPGVSAGSRSVRQTIEQIGGKRYILTKRHPLQLVLPQTVWYSRAWTFQENLLSTRRLYFTDEHVFYVCDQDGGKRLENPVCFWKILVLKFHTQAGQ